MGAEIRMSQEVREGLEEVGDIVQECCKHWPKPLKNADFKAMTLGWLHHILCINCNCKITKLVSLLGGRKEFSSDVIWKTFTVLGMHVTTWMHVKVMTQCLCVLCDEFLLFLVVASFVVCRMLFRQWMPKRRRRVMPSLCCLQITLSFWLLSF